MERIIKSKIKSKLVCFYKKKEFCNFSCLNEKLKKEYIFVGVACKTEFL